MGTNQQGCKTWIVMSYVEQEMAPKLRKTLNIDFCFVFFFFFSIAAFFQDCISEQDLDEMNIEIIRNTLYKVEFINNWAKLYLYSHCHSRWNHNVLQKA